MSFLKHMLKRFSESSLGQFYQKYNRDQVPLYVTVIAYNAILTMFPILLAILAILGLFVRDQRALQTVNDAIIHIFPSQVEGDALRVIEASRTGSGIFALISFLGLLWAGSALFGIMGQAFNRAFDVPDRGFVQQKLMAFGMIFLFAFFLVVAVVASSLATFLVSFSQEAFAPYFPDLSWLDTLTVWLASILANLVLFLLIYWVIPNRSFTFREVWPGAILAAIMFFVIVQVWPLYLTVFGRFGTFGDFFGLFFLIMTWFYFLALIVMLGAELNAFSLARRPEKHDLETRSEK